MLEDALDDGGALDDGHGLHAAAATGALQGIDVPDLLQKNGPHPSSADGA